MNRSFEPLDTDEMSHERAISIFVEAQMRAGRRRMVSAADEPPPPPRLPMFTGVFTFPWRLSVIAAWMFMSFGMIVAAWLVMLWFGPGADLMGNMSTRTFGAAACMSCILSFGYAVTCCLTIIEATSNGWDHIEVRTSIEWQEWAWNFGRIATLMCQAAFVGEVFRWLDGSGAFFPLVVGTFFALPFVLLGALADGESWFPLGIKTILRSVSPLWWAWLMFYAEAAVVIWGWVWLTGNGLREEPWLTPLYAAPLLAAVILIYARLLGRLAGCIVRETTKMSREGDDDEEP
jgi:hypothetical protein